MHPKVGFPLLIILYVVRRGSNINRDAPYRPRRALSASKSSSKQLHGQCGVCRPAPPIALNAANKPLAVVVDLNQRAMARGRSASSDH